MSISEEEVRKVATLARMHLTDAEVKKFAPQLEKIIDYIDMLNEVDTSDVPVTAQVTGLQNVMRPDIVVPWTAREELLVCSPLPIEHDQIKVPSVFDES